MKNIEPLLTPWAGTMTGRDRFLAQMRGQPFDRCFNREFGFWRDSYLAWPLLADNHIDNEDEANLFFAFDPMPCISPRLWQARPMQEIVVSETATTLIRQNAEGVIEEVFKADNSSIPRYLRSSIETPDDWKRVKDGYFRRDDPVRAPDFAHIERVFQENPDAPIGIDCGSMIGRIRNLLTLEGLAYAVYDYPDMVEDMVETACLLCEDQLDMILPHFHFDYASGWEDICCKNGPLVNLDFFKAVVGPAYGRINKKLKAHGIDIWYTDCDGDVRPLIPTFLENGINCLFPYEVNGCCHPADLLQEYDGALGIMGGFDKMQMIKGKDAIRAYMRSLEPWVAKGHLIPFCDHRCPPDVTPENYLYYLELKEQTFGLSRKA